MHKLNKRGTIDPVSLIVVTGAIYATACVGITYAIGGKELAKKNGQSIWAYMTNQCGSGSTDARCIK